MTLFEFARAHVAPERTVGRWVLKTGIPIERDNQPRHHARAQRPEWPFAKMLRGECFEIRPQDVGEEDLLRTANVVSSAASQAKRAAAREGNVVDFKTAQIGGRFVRCWRVL